MNVGRSPVQSDIIRYVLQVQALQFEWAWQHPEKSKAVRDDMAALVATCKKAGLSGAKGKVGHPEFLNWTTVLMFRNAVLICRDCTAANVRRCMPGCHYFTVGGQMRYMNATEALTGIFLPCRSGY